MPTAITSWRGGEEEKRREEKRREEKRGEERRGEKKARRALLKSNTPHLAGGEIVIYIYIYVW